MSVTNGCTLPLLLVLPCYLYLKGMQSQELKQITETDDAVQSKYDNANFGANLNAKVLRRLTLRATSAIFLIHFRNNIMHITAQNENKLSQCLSVME
jgi:hypothetical protein